ncbi:MAG TPA: hypothetical protein VIK61_06385, partial [Acidimicrobiia bacterium]
AVRWGRQSNMTSTSVPSPSTRVGLALSGGGFRATAWSAGAIAGLLRARDLERTKPGAHDLEIVSIASVSGGSIANGFVATRFQDLNARDLTVVDFAAAMGPLTKVVADDGMIFFAKATNAFVLSAFAAIGLAALATVACVVLAVISGHAVITLALAIAALVLWVVAVVLFSRRGRVVERLLERSVLADPSGRPVMLGDLADRATHHVFCATELQSGDQFHMSPRLIYGYQFGQTRALGQWTLARAVQASAALPLGFPPQHSVLADYGLAFSAPTWSLDDPPPAGATRKVALVDGGVYDNMGTEWEVAYANRASHITDLHDLQPPADLLVVANAGKALGWQTIWSRLRVVWELRGPVRDQSIQYDQTTAPRRSALIRTFQAGERGLRGAQRGVIVQASTSVFDVAKRVAEETSAPEKAARAARWRDALLKRRSEAEWKALAAQSAGVKTVLHALGRPTTLNLIEHALVLTQMQLHVHYGIGDVQVITEAELRARFGGGA